jgi:hypothetical protein
MVQKMIVLKRSWMLLCLVLASCDHVDPSSVFDCQVKGEIFRYQAGQRVSPQEEQTLNLQVTIYQRRSHFLISGNEQLAPELANTKIVLNDKNSNAVERYYQLDQLDEKTGERRASNMVLHTLSGDVRLFHRHWQPPNEWKNSNQYMLKGHCKKVS